MKNRQLTIPELLEAILAEVQQVNKNLKKQKADANNKTTIEKRERKTPEA